MVYYREIGLDHLISYADEMSENRNTPDVDRIKVDFISWLNRYKRAAESSLAVLAVDHAHLSPGFVRDLRQQR